MEIIYFLVPVGIVMLAVAIGVFSWAVRSDQFEDLDREGRRILFDEDMVAPTQKTQPSQTSASTSATSSDAASSQAPNERSQDGTKS